MKTGIEELKEKTTDYINIVNELAIAVPYADVELKADLLRLSDSLVELSETLKRYH